MISKKKTLKKNLSNIEKQFHILINNNLLFNYLLFKGSKSGKPNKTFLEAWPIRGGGGEFWGWSRIKNCVVREERGFGEGWVTPFVKEICCEHGVTMLWTCCEHVVSIWWKCDDHVLSMMWTCDGNVINMWWTEHAVNMFTTCCEQGGLCFPEKVMSHYEL